MRWCTICNDWRQIAEEFDAQIGYEEQAREVWVTVLDCGHEQDRPLHGNRH